ncbi:hypothetical protein N7451_010342, partial [Penicillium sp. IBT 35674x]
EPWIASKLYLIESAEEKEDSGLAIYRLTYGQTDSEWLEFVQKLEAHISDWGMGQMAVKPSNFIRIIRHRILWRPASTMLSRDFAGFVCAIKLFDPKEGASRPEESPGYPGQMRVVGSLVESQSAGLQELCPLAMHHPNKVYVGPIAPLQLCSW